MMPLQEWLGSGALAMVLVPTGAMQAKAAAQLMRIGALCPAP